MKSKKDKVSLEIIGGNSEGVTGSCTKIEYSGHIYLFEMGANQCGNTILETYRRNRTQLQKIKPKDVEIIIISHCHHDHTGLIPALFKTGKCNARIIVPKGSTRILKEMWKDSSYINQRDAEYLTKKTGVIVEPLYSEEDVDVALSYVEEVESHQIIELDESLSIRYIPAGHILLSQQCEVFVGTSRKRKILFTGDLGNIKTQDMKFYLENFEPINTANIVIGECTYGARGREVTKAGLQEDIQKIKTVIEQYTIIGKGRVLIPTFALDRTLYVLSILYQLFKDSGELLVVLDSPLAIRLLHHYGELLDEESKTKFDDILNWKCLKMIIEPNDSRAAIADKRPKVVLSASGMMTAGRSVHWTESLLPRSEDCILFCGYCGTDTLGWKIKHDKAHKTVTINGKPIRNRCQIVDLTSFSSHMQYSDLLKYYKGIHCDKIYLVHGDMNTKIEFKKDLEQAITESLRTTRVIATNKSTKISL